MATAEEYASWIVDNQDKRGTPVFETVAKAYRQARASQAVENDPITQGAKNFNADASFGQNFKAGIGSGFHGIAQGIGQLVGASSIADSKETERLTAPLKNTGAGKAGEILGNVALLAPTAFIPGANTMLGAGLIGATTGALTTPGDLGQRATAAIYGGAGGMAGQALPRVLGSVKAAAEPFTQGGRDKIIGRLMNRTVGDDAAQVAARLKTAQPLLPGSMPTAAEVAESGGIAALQRAMSAADPEAYAHRGMQQASARVGALRGIAGDDAKMAAAVAARDSAASPLYDAAKAAIVPGDAELKAILNRPVMRNAWAKAQELAANKGEKITLSAKPAGVVVETDAAGIPIIKDVAEQAQQYSGKGLHYLKLALDDMLTANPATALGRNEKAAIMGNKEQLLGWLEKNIPEYGQASKAYAAGSKPINQMQVGQELLDKISPALADHGALARETANRYATALRNSEQTAKSATGFKQGLEDVMTPDQMDVLQRVAQDLARKANAQDLGRGVGSNTFQNLAMDNLSASMGGPGVLKALGAIPGVSPTVTLLSKAGQAGVGLAYKNADELMRKDIAQALLNPQAAARLMESASQPGMVLGLLNSLPNNIKRSIPPEDIIKLIQSSPGLLGMGIGQNYVN